ncbi:MAG: glycosyltransferase family 2 protein, partial [Pseudomonadota bacterium]
DNARNLPAPGEILKKLLGGKSSVYREEAGKPLEPDWLAGMFLVFPCAVFRELQGFDERYFMYYEDVDICVRLRLAGYRVRLCGGVAAIHEAQRSSHRNLRHLGWHMASMLRFFLSEPYRRIRRTTGTGA